MSGLAAAAAALLALLAVLAVAAVAAFDLYCLARLLAAGRPRLLPAAAWALLIVGFSPAGGAAYLLCRRWPARSPGNRPASRRPRENEEHPERGGSPRGDRHDLSEPGRPG